MRSDVLHFAWAKWVLLFIAAQILVIVVGFTFFSSSGRDDAHITYWPAYTLSKYGELLNYNGARVEQSSSLLQVIVIWAIGLTGMDTALAGPLSTLLFAAVTVVLAYALARKLIPDASVYAIIVVSTAPFFAYWAVGGMDTTLTSAAAIFLILSWAQFLENGGLIRSLEVIVAALCFAAVRPETQILVIVLAPAALILLLLRRFTVPATANPPSPRVFLSRMVWLFGIALLMAVALLIFRLLYFNSPVPQPVIAKQSLGSTTIIRVLVMRLREGLEYYRDQVLESVFYAIPGLLIVVSLIYTLIRLMRDKDINWYLAFSFLFVTGDAAFVLFSGGDVMEAGRFIAPFLPTALLLAMFFLYYGLERIAKREYFSIAIAGLVLVQIGGLIYLATSDSTGSFIWEGLAQYRQNASDAQLANYNWFELANAARTSHLKVIPYLDRLVGQVLPQHDPVVILSQQMGIVNYYLVSKYFGHIEVVDPYGLVERSLTSCPVAATLSRTPVGLFMSFERYFSLKNDLQNQCGVANPDLIWYINDDYQQLMTANGYTPLDLHQSSIWVSIRNDLMPSVDVSFLQS